MDHGRLFSTSNPTLNQETNLRGIQLSAALNQVTQEDLNKFSNVREFEISALDGRAMLIAKNGQTSELLFTEANSSPNQDYLISTARSAVSQAWPETSIKVAIWLQQMMYMVIYARAPFLKRHCVLFLMTLTRLGFTST